MEPGSIIAELGGGLSAVVIVALAIAVWRVITWWRSDSKENAETLIGLQKEGLLSQQANTTATNEVAAAMRELAREVRDASR